MPRRFDTIRTARLVMRRWRDADRDAFAGMNADPVVMRYFPATLDRAASDAYVDRMEDLFARQGFGLWALEVAGTAEFIGFTGLNPMPPGVPGEGGMEVGWRLAQRVASGLRHRGGHGRRGRGLQRGRPGHLRPRQAEVTSIAGWAASLPV